MINYLEKLVFSLERNLKNTVVAFRMYGAIFAFCFVAFVLNGILPLSKTLKAKTGFLKELQIAHATMQINFENAQLAEKNITENELQIALLDRYMPQETDAQSYMLNFVESIGADGYTLKTFSQENSDNPDGQIDLSITLEGFAYPIDLVKNVETLKRVTQVKRITINQNNQGMLTINMLVTIYTLIL